MNKRPSGFTLIELLIVVAIIAILAAIAIPNLLEAQVRAKCSRAVADMRTVANAVEAYFIDANDYPRNNMSRNWTVSRDLTTPVAYLTSANLVDPFALFKENDPLVGLPYYSYHRVLPGSAIVNPPKDWWSPEESTDGPIGVGNPGAFRKYGEWRLLSLGPDRAYLPPDWQSFSRPVIFQMIETLYDPTNGTVSYGNIQRTQLAADGRVPQVYP